MIRPKPTKGSDVHNNPTARVPFYGLVCLSSAWGHWVSPHTVIGVGPPGPGTSYLLVLALRGSSDFQRESFKWLDNIEVTVGVDCAWWDRFGSL